MVLILAALLLAGMASAERVVVIGFDGLSPDGIRKARTPNFDRLRASGAWTFRARGVMPTSSSPNWASMIMGAGPEQHGVTSNDWMPDKFEIAPVVVGSAGIFPTIFGLLRRERPKAVIGVFHDWEGFGRLVEKGVPNAIEHPKGPVETVNRAVRFLHAAKPDLLFIHLDHVDHAGHEHGHGGPQYLAAVEEADRLAGVVVDALREAKLSQSTVLLLTADHGGVGKKHGGPTMAEIEIPWIIHGPGIAPGREIRAPVNTYDTAATIARILGLQPPEGWIGRPVLEAFSR